MKGSAYTIGYAAVLGSVCALLLTAAAGFTKKYREANQEAEEAVNILLALKVPLQEDMSSKQVVDARKENVQEKTLGDITTYDYSPPDANDEVLATAVRFSGPGLWGPIKGFLALEPDMKTIRGMTFYEQEETPGLGGEIAASWFLDQFVGKSIVDTTGAPGIIISSAGEPAVNKVDGISGATMTCDKVQAMLNEAIKSIVEEKQ
ncbi:MAG: FMN-binding protein [Planctomycetota bacterium]|jgi:Na+-transporting NADH:ubiquinone oxidoreductase subunit C